MAVVITHPEMGVYVGHGLGMGFWTRLDSVGQDAVVCFPSEAAARAHVASWYADSSAPPQNDPDAYGYAPVTPSSTRGRETYADVAALREAGLGHLLGGMEADAAIEAAARSGFGFGRA